jgi:hypothetical protein
MVIGLMVGLLDTVFEDRTFALEFTLNVFGVDQKATVLLFDEHDASLMIDVETGERMEPDKALSKAHGFVEEMITAIGGQLKIEPKVLLSPAYPEGIIRKETSENRRIVRNLVNQETSALSTLSRNSSKLFRLTTRT